MYSEALIIPAAPYAPYNVSGVLESSMQEKFDQTSWMQAQAC